MGVKIMDDVKDMSLVGFYNFSSKDRTKKFFVIQVLFYEEYKSLNSIKSNIINIFVDEQQYNNIVENKNIGSILKVRIKASLTSGKVYYSITND